MVWCNCLFNGKSSWYIYLDVALMIIIRVRISYWTFESIVQRRGLVIPHWERWHLSTSHVGLRSVLSLQGPLNVGVCYCIGWCYPWQSPFLVIHIHPCLEVFCSPRLMVIFLGRALEKFASQLIKHSGSWSYIVEGKLETILTHIYSCTCREGTHWHWHYSNSLSLRLTVAYCSDQVCRF